MRKILIHIKIFKIIMTYFFNHERKQNPTHIPKSIVADWKKKNESSTLSPSSHCPATTCALSSVSPPLPISSITRSRLLTSSGRPSPFYAHHEFSDSRSMIFSIASFLVNFKMSTQIAFLDSCHG